MFLRKIITIIAAGASVNERGQNVKDGVAGKSVGLGEGGTQFTL